MANYRRGTFDFVIDSSFQPFTMQEMLVPFTAYKDAYEKTEEQYINLSSQADKFKYLADTLDPDSKAAQIYNGYANDLKAQAEDLAHNGLSMGNRRALTNMRRRYQGEIGRLVEADAARKAQIAEQQKIALQDPTRMFSREASASSLDYYLDNQDTSYKSYSGALLAQQVGSAASAIAKSLSDYGAGKPLDNYTKTWIQQHGYSPAQVLQAIQNPNSEGASAILNSLVESTIDSSGMRQWADTSTLNQAYNYARQGLWNAVGQSNIASYEDYGRRQALQNYYHELQADNAATRAAATLAQQQAGLLGGGNTTGTNPQFDTRNVRTANNVAAAVKDKEMWDKYGKYFYKDEKTGTWKINDEGRKKYNETSHVYHGPYSTAKNTAENEFKMWVDSHNLSEMGKGRVGKGQSQTVDAIYNRAHDILDVHSDIEYTRAVGATNYDNVLSVLNHVATDGKITNYKREKQKDGYSYSKDKDIDVAKLSSTDIKSAHVVYGEHGDFLEVKLKDGSTVVQPYNILSPTYSAVVQGNKGTIAKYIEAKNNGIKAMEIRPGVVVSIDDLINAELNGYGSNLISALHFDEVEPEKVASGYYGTR